MTNLDLNSSQQFQNRWFRLIRAIWVIAFTLYAGLFLIAFPPYWRQWNTTARWIPLGWTEAEAFSALTQLNLTLPAYLVLYTVIASIPACLSFAIGGFLFRKTQDRMALVVSFLFITLPYGSPIFSALSQNLSAAYPASQFFWKISGTLFIYLLILLFYLLPDGRFVPKWTLGAGIGWSFLFFVDAENIGTLTNIMVILILAGTLLYAPIYRYLRVSTSKQKWQTTWLVLSLGIGALVLGGVGLIGVFIPTLAEHTAVGLIYYLAIYAAWQLFLLFIPLAFTIAILRSGLFDIQVIIRKTLQYSALTVLLGLVYFGCVILLQSLIGQNQSEFVTVLSTLAIAGLFNPLRTRVQDFIDRRFYRKKYNAEQALAQFATVARDEVELDKLNAALIEVVEETVQPERVSLWLINSETKPQRRQVSKD